NLSRYVAVGGGYTSGYSDSALYLSAQRYSYPAILASRFALAGGGAFEQPLVNAGVGIGLKGNARYHLIDTVDCLGNSYLKAAPVSPVGDLTNYNWIGAYGPYNNMGVPGTRMANVFLQSFGDPSMFIGNPFYARFASNPGISTIIGDAIGQAPTFYTIWMGLEDIYGYARRGGKESGDTITSVQSFIGGYTSLIAGMKAVGAHGVIANLPAPGTMPFFNAVAVDGLLLTQQQADSLNMLYAPINPAIVFQQGRNRYVINDNSAPGGRRQIETGEKLLLTLPMDSIRCYSWGRLVPIPSRYVLDAQELGLVNDAVINYNAAISQLGQQEGIPVVSMYDLFNEVAQGSSFGGTVLSAAYPKGGFYSVDGFFPTPRGYAFIANRFVSVINTAFQAKLPFADINSYPAVAFP
ncbi:MAG TPA: SGNH/GDSL hydrolase family protein, partial [Bacteroidia bacterium]|nr:SGNH/GDSL hydrolase family protein [Bacteroidia bacterium]